MAGIRRLIGVYDAEGTFRGEVTYVVGRMLGRRHCALCEITHGWSPLEKRSSRACRSGLPVPFDLLHLDERPPVIADATEGKAPVVLAETDAGLVELLDRDALEALDGDPERLVGAVEEAAALAGLAFAGSE